MAGSADIWTRGMTGAAHGAGAHSSCPVFRSIRHTLDGLRATISASGVMNVNRRWPYSGFFR